MAALIPKNIPPKNSLSFILLKRIFGYYLIVAVVLTILQLMFYYKEVKSDFKQELVAMANSSEQTLSTAMWEFNARMENTVLNGFIKNPRVIGVRLLNTEMQPLQTVKHTQKIIPKTAGDEHYFQSDSDGYFSLVWPLHYLDLQQKRKIIGYVEINSSDRLVFERVYFDFFVILINALLKTAALGLIILISLREILYKPLKIMTEDLDHINDKSLDDSIFKRLTPNALELYTLQDGFHRMLDRLSLAFSQLNKNEQLLNQQINHDSLTSLPNRKHFEEQAKRFLKAANRQNKYLGLFFFDLNGFKKINDSYGHLIGDKLLISVSSKINLIIRESDFLARMSGDEFVVITDIMETKDEIYPLIQRIQTEFNQPLMIDGHSIICTPSIGIAFYPEAKNLEQLLKQADLAMYEAKKDDAQQIPVCFYTDKMAHKYSRIQLIESKLGEAIKAGEISTHFQPIISNKNPNKVIIEALARWESKELGWITPDEFIPIAENTPAINSITKCILSDCYTLIESLSKEGIAVEKISINLSASQLSSPVFIDLLIDWLTTLKLDTSVISFDLTEREVVKNAELMNSQIKRIQALGITLALDDYGSGYSSLTHLLNLPINILKIDRSLIDHIDQNPLNLALVAGIVEMSKRLKLEVIVEGIEREQEYTQVKNLGCLLHQGYYFAKPMKNNDVVEYYKKLHS